MTGLAKKLQVPPDVTLTVLHAPDELSPLLDALAAEHIRTLKRDPKRAMSSEGKRRTKG